MTASRRVLMVSPHFPPDSSAASHRVRLLAPHLEEAGLVADRRHARAVGVRRKARPRSRSARAAFAARGPRAGVDGRDDAHGRSRRSRAARASPVCGSTCRTLLRREPFDALFITVYPVYPALLRRRPEGRVPRAVRARLSGSVGRRVGAVGRRRTGWRPGLEEPRVALARHAARTEGGQRRRRARRGLAGHDRRHRRADSGRGARAARRHPARIRARRLRVAAGIVRSPPRTSIRPTATCTCATSARCCRPASRRCGCCCARSSARGATIAAAARLRLHFFGTSNQSESAVCRVLPIARECGVADAVTEQPARLDYLDALSVLTHASGILLLGSSERHYTASKLYPALLAQRPILALFHQQSSVVSILRDAASEPTVRVVTYGDGPPDETHVHARRPVISARWPRRAAYRPADVVARSRRRRVGAPTRAPARRGLRSGGAMSRPIRLTAVLTHPIQYYAPWFRHLHANAPEIELTVVHATQPTPEQQGVGFDRAFAWDIPLTEGYRLDHGAAGPAGRSHRQRRVHRPRRAGDRPGASPRPRPTSC